MEEKEDHPQQNISSVETEKKKGILLPVVLSVLLSSLIVGSSVFFWQQTKMEKKIGALESQIEEAKKDKTNLEGQLEQIRNDNAVLKERLDDLAKTTTEAIAEKEKIEEKTCRGVWKNGVCLQSSCVDSDVNEKAEDIYIKGKVTYTDENGLEKIFYDECSASKKQVNEGWCYESPAGSGNYVPGKKVYDCENGCLDGACVK